MKKIQIIIGVVLIAVIFYIAASARTARDTLPLEPHAKTRHFEQPKPSDEYLPYPDAVLGELSSKTDNDLRAFRCTETLYRNQEGHYLFYNPANKHYDFRLQDEPIMQQIKNIEVALKPPQKFLSGRVCIAENKDVLFMYSIGEADQDSRDFNYLGTSVTTYINGVQISNVANGPYFHCQAPLEITKNGTMYYHCTQIENGTIRNWYWKIDLSAKTSTPLAECTYPIVGKPPKACK